MDRLLDAYACVHALADDFVVFDPRAGGCRTSFQYQPSRHFSLAPVADGRQRVHG